MKQLLNRLFIAEVIVIIFVATFFAFIPNKQVAGIAAGTLFLSLGFTLLGIGLKSNRFRTTATFWFGLVHLAVSILMVSVRATHWGVPFEELRYVFLTGPEFHSVANYTYSAMMIATLFDRYRFRR